MSSFTLWRCRNETGCIERPILGEVRDGVLWLYPVVDGMATADRHGVLRVPCPSCGQTREWRPQVPLAGREGR